MDIIIEYNEQKCIGAQKCVEKDPAHFRFGTEKAILLDAVQLDGKSVLKVNLDDQQLAKAIDAAQLCPVNAIKVCDASGKVLVSDAVELKKQVRHIKADYDDLKEFVMDEKGYFLIRVNQDEKEIEVAFCSELNKIAATITGTKPLEIYQTIIKQGFISRMDHAAYLGRELQKAYLALQKNIPYVQDDELNL